MIHHIDVRELFAPPAKTCQDASIASLLEAAAVAVHLLPPPLVAELDALRDGLSPAGALVVSGIPTGELGATPPSPQDAAKTDDTSEMWLLAVASVLGDAVGYSAEHGGDLIQNLVPVERNARSQMSTSSAVTLAWHTETAFHPHKPKWLLLLALRGDEAARTMVCDVRDVVDALDDHTVEVLRTARFTTGIDASFGSSKRRVGPHPILRGDPGDSGDTRLWFDEDLMAGIDAESNTALRTMIEAVSGCAGSVTLQAGQCLVIDNDRVAHGRSPYTPRYDGTDRWLQRAFVVRDLGPSATQRDGRTIITSFDD